MLLHPLLVNFFFNYGQVLHVQVSVENDLRLEVLHLFNLTSFQPRQILRTVCQIDDVE